ncbi:MAG: UDP-N-acetylglucosamine 2-epimerase (non-hydrolyzing) [Bacteroidetes bacterium]|nr:UDP-N-acetylglucosamine 2-epimerase (non-hydrolyzing) [Bacteroidota bacterium]MBM3424514.1 UDP-N-acetylglucosamine 2-epimerase (non-hydrolyzing) [Bacteroidota bacterium]
MKIVTIVGARPQIIKAAAISRAIAKDFSNDIADIILHTGQHYDDNMSEIFFSEMNIPKPQYQLATGSGSHGLQTAKMLEGIERVLQTEKPDALLVYGDTNSTLAGALAAVKLHIPVVHVEAGLRSYNKSMPEEINRIACDHCSTLLFSPSEQGIRNLHQEGLINSSQQKASVDQPKIFKTGDVMFDNSMYFEAISRKKPRIVDHLQLSDKRFMLCTIHRDSNTDISKNLNSIVEGLISIQELSQQTLILPLHPRTRKKMVELLNPTLLEKLMVHTGFKIIEPAGFLDMISLESRCSMVITDSGGVQKEAFFFQKPCIILRNETEWVEIVENGNAILAGADAVTMLEAYRCFQSVKNLTYPPLFGDGHAAEEICRLMLKNL